MYILTNNKNEITAISKICERIEEYRNIKLDDHNIAYAPDEQINIYEVESVAEEISERKYCYTEEQGFYKNPNYREPEPTPEEQIKILKEEIEKLKEEMTDSQLALAELAEGGM